MKTQRINKSALAIGTKPKVEDNAYRASFKDRTCEASSNGIDRCGLPCVGAHVRAGEYAGIGTKPSDDLIAGLCHEHHADQEANPGADWWINNVFKPMLRRKYRKWKTGQ